MSLRTKLLVSLAVVIILGISLASWAVYKFARNELEVSKKRRLAQDAEMLARQIEAWLQKSKSNVVLWADMPIVRRVALKPGDPAGTADACRLFQRIVETTGVYQTVNLMSTNAACIASSIPSRIGLRPMEMVVATRSDFQEAAAGKASISPMFVAASNGRPIIAISTPVWEGRKVIAVVRAVIDMAFFDDMLLKPEKVGSAGRSGILAPDFEMKLSEYIKYRDISDTIIQGKKYRPLEIPVPLAELAAESGIINYHDKNNEDNLAAFHRIKEPEWIIVVEEPLQEVLAPIRNLGRVAFLTAIMLIAAVFGVVFLIVNPRLRSILMCLSLVQEIGAGNLDARLHLRSKDEIGRLAKGLNTMAAGLADSRQALEEAERTYRGIFENAVEGIFQADGDLLLITANPSFAQIMGYKKPEEMIGNPLSAFFAGAAPKDAFFIELQDKGVVESFECKFVRRDGTFGSGSLFARADKDDQGHVVFIQGMLADITEKQKVERERLRAEEAERHLAQSRLQTLRYQINPHFLFNILNSIDALAKQAPQRIPELIRELSRYLRFTLTDQGNGLVPLYLELDAITSYLKLEKIRFEEDMVVEIIAPPNCGQALVPELLLQPLVENAIKYGMRTSPLPLRIAIRCSTLADKMLAVEVANTGEWLSERQPGRERSGIGLLNLRQRLALLYPETSSLTLKAQGGWIIAKVELPLSRADNEVQ